MVDISGQIQNRYVPRETPLDYDVFYFQDELRRISLSIELLAAGHIDETNVAPDKPRTGDIRLADGTNWNPGSGQGIYARYNNAWNFLG